jgi:hypothetical protein
MGGRQPASGLVGKLLSEAEDGQTRLLMSAINVGEVYYFRTPDLARSFLVALENRMRRKCIC